MAASEKPSGIFRSEHLLPVFYRMSKSSQSVFLTNPVLHQYCASLVSKQKGFQELGIYEAQIFFIFIGQGRMVQGHSHGSKWQMTWWQNLSHNGVSAKGEGWQLTSDTSWGFGAFSFSFLLLGISCLMRLAPETFVLFSFSCELFSCFRGLIGGRGLSSSPLINLSYGRINLKEMEEKMVSHQVIPAAAIL